MQKHVEVISSGEDVHVKDHVQFSGISINVSQHFVSVCSWKLTDKYDVLSIFVYRNGALFLQPRMHHWPIDAVLWLHGLELSSGRTTSESGKERSLQ